jgi:hypothetical protein
MRMPSQRIQLRTAPIGAAYRRKEPTAAGRAACLALNLCGRYLKNEDLLKKTCGSIAIQNEVRTILSHGTCPPEGPKRSVLIVRGSCPSSTRTLEAVSTKGVGPQTKIFGCCSDGKHASATIALSILRRWPTHPPVRLFAGQRVDDTQIRIVARHCTEFLSIDDVFQTSG